MTQCNAVTGPAAMHNDLLFLECPKHFPNIQYRVKKNCEYACLGECRFRASGPTSEKNRRKIDFGLTGTMGKKSSKNRKNGAKTDKNRFSSHFSYFWAIFSLFSREAKIDFSAFFPKSAFSQARILKK